MNSILPLPHGYKITRTPWTVALFRNRYLVTVFGTGTPDMLIREVALKDAAFRAGVKLRNLHIFLERLHGSTFREIAVRWRLSDRRVRQIVISTAVAIGYPVYTCPVCQNGSGTVLLGYPCRQCRQSQR